MRIKVAGESHDVGADEMEVVEEAQSAWIVRSEGRCTVGLDPAIGDELRLEGLARELVNRIQRLRRDSGLAVTDRIRLGIAGDEAVCAAALEHGDAIARETLAVALEIGPRLDDGYTHHKEDGLDGNAAVLGLSVSASP